jgi:hypothetical protein
MLVASGGKRGQDFRRGIYPAKVVAQFLDRWLVGGVSLGHEDGVGDRDLGHRLRVLAQVQWAVYGVHGGYDPLWRVVMTEDGIGEDRVRDWRRIG